MCGIAVVLHRDRHRRVDGTLLDAMTDVMAYRGPDERGTYAQGNVGLGHRRLSIIDIRGGQQPMVDSRRARAIVYNGEIYNFRALRNGLAESCLHTSSDTEVLLQLADRDSTAWLELLNGMFAFAVWEANSRTLVLARDRLGVKPLYYTDLQHTVLFASEIKPLLLHPDVARRMDESKVAEFLAFRSLAGNETLFQGIRQVPPGHMLVLAPPDYRFEFRRYWREGEGSAVPDEERSGRAAVAQFEAMLSDSVASRLISEVPVGTYNSGGVDSSLVTALVSSVKQDRLHTFSVGFEEASHDESRYAAIVARKYATTHHALIVRRPQYQDSLTEAIWHLEEPINHPHTVQLLLLSRLAKEFVTVVLTGEGADEVFGGYPRYKLLRLKQLFDAMPGLSSLVSRLLGDRFGPRIGRLASALASIDTVAAVQNSRFVPGHELAAVLPGIPTTGPRPEIFARCTPAGDLTNRLLYYDQRTYLPSLLMRLDKMSMAASIEARVPFLDYRLVEWSYRLPASVKIRGLCSKWLVKQCALRWLPRSIVHRRKFGFDVPIGAWLRDRAGLGQMLDLLEDRTFGERGHCNPAAVHALVDEHRRGERNHTEILWSLLNLELWCRMFVDASPMSWTRGAPDDGRSRTNTVEAL